VRNELGCNELSNEHGKVGGNGSHTVFQVLCKIGTILRDFENLLSKSLQVVLILLKNFSSHGDLCSFLDFLSNVFISNNLG
jgi:hypothetical protein